MSLFQFSWIKLGSDVNNNGIKLEKNSDIDMYLFIEKELKRAMCYICKRHINANKKDIKNFEVN